MAACAFAMPSSAATAPRSVYSPHKDAMVPTKGTKWLGALPATWYGPGFFGRRTACGSTLKKTTWGIAHRTLPCGTLVYLSFKGKRIAVPVVDRGPWGGADIDLTERVAKRLNFKGVDRGSVKVGKMRYKIAKSKL
jgi:rare lipoprotein A